MAKARKQGVPLAELPLADFQEADPSLDEVGLRRARRENAVAAMQSHGSTGPEQVRRQVARWKKKLAEQA